MKMGTFGALNFTVRRTCGGGGLHTYARGRKSIMISSDNKVSISYKHRHIDTHTNKHKQTRVYIYIYIYMTASISPPSSHQCPGGVPIVIAAKKLNGDMNSLVTMALLNFHVVSGITKGAP